MNSPRRNDPAFAAACLTLPGSATVFAVAVLGLWRKDPFFQTWFYVFAWWAYILCAEAWLYLVGGDSVLFTRPGAFLSSLPISISIWLVFEMFNFRVRNWHYVNLPSSLVLRWFGYCASFATVVPGLFVTQRILDRLGLFARRAFRPVHLQASWRPIFTAAGTTSLIACLAWPRYAFPLLWLGFVFLLDPINDHFGRRSLFAQLQMGELRPALQLLLSGLICGILWEAWNFWAGSKWIYSVPFFNRPKIFEMPLAGYLGFPPFALECFVMVQSWRLFLERFSECKPPFASRNIRRIGGFALLAVHVLILVGMDRFTVLSFR